MRVFRYGSPYIVNKPGKIKKTQCSIQGCDNETQIIKGFCWKHYGRFKKYGNPLYAVKASRGRNVKKCKDSPQGYKRIPIKESIFGSRYEHRDVMEKLLDRKLDIHNEEIHHINGDIKDNRIENLIVCSSKEHKSFHPRHRQMRLCSIENCNKVHEAKGYCKNHYGKYRRNHLIPPSD